MTEPEAPCNRPAVRLRPKADPAWERRASPWVFADELVLDRRTRSLPAGTIARLEGADRRPLATVAVTPAARVVARVLDRDPQAEIDRAWISARLAQALALRQRLGDPLHCRLVNGEGDALPGLVIDRFGQGAVIQPNAAWAERLREEIIDALVALTGVENVVVNGMARARRAEGLEATLELVRGQLDGPVPVPMNGATYMADLLGGQKTGLYYDQRPNHALAARLAPGGQVLDVFSHVGGFSLAALVAGAAGALAVDGSARALELAREGARASGVADRLETLEGDAFEAMATLGAEGRRFDLVVADPPAFAPSTEALQAGLRAYGRVARLAARLVRPGGFLVLCSCSHAADLTRFRKASLGGIGRAGRQVQQIHTGLAGPDHPFHPALAETGYLKALFFRVLD